MQRTYGRRAQRRRSPKDGHELDNLSQSNPSPPRKRPKVYVEIISPKGKKSYPGGKHTPPSLSLTSDARKLPTISESKPTATLFDLSESPKTPEKSPRHPSPFVTPSRLSRSDSRPMRGSIIKRMLGRSRTESSLEATPSPDMLSVLPSSVQITRQASSHSLPTAFPERETTPEASTQSSLPTRNIKTYAGSSRSFLVTLPLPDTNPLRAVEDDTEPHESYTDLRARWGIDLAEDDPQSCKNVPSTALTPLRRKPSDLSQSSLPPNMMNDLKSITELRSKGESRRFLDEVGYLFEGLDCSSAIGLRRASALEVVNKLCDSDFNRRAKTSDFYIRTWNQFWAARAGTSDKVFDATITFFAALTARDPHTLMEVAQQKDFVSTLVEILSSLDHRKDVLASVLASGSDHDLKSHGMLQTEIAALKSLATLVSKETLSFPVNQPSARLFVSHSLAMLPPFLLADQHLPTLLASLRAELDLVEPRIAAYESGLPLFPSHGTSWNGIPSLCHIEACLRLFDSYLLGHWPSTTADGHSSRGLSHLNGFTSELMSLCAAAAGLFSEDNEEMEMARKCLCGALRVLTLLSHDDPWWCGAALEVSHALSFTTMTVMRSQSRWSASRHAESQQSSIEAFDLLCLALGLIMNWATLSPQVATFSRTESINPTCPGSRACIRTCRCTKQISILECFAALHVQYAYHRPDEADLPECAFLRGYTAILVGLLVKDDSANQVALMSMSMLPGTCPVQRVQSLVGHCRAFLDSYNDAPPLRSSPELPQDTCEADLREHEHEHGHVATSRHHRATWDRDRRGDAIARNVIASLEKLCST